MAKVGIIGTGKIGSHLAETLLNSKSITHIQLANRNEQRLEGRLKSLRLLSNLLGSSIVVEKLNWEKINDLDLIAICVKDNYDPRELLKHNSQPNWFPRNLRYIGLLNDLPLLSTLCHNNLTNYNGKIAVITNPVEITSFFIAKWLPNAKVFGLGATVDAARISFVIKNELDVSIPKYRCIVSGEHGNDLRAVSKLWDTENKLQNFGETQISDYIKKAESIGIEIVTNLGFTLQDCVPVFGDDIEWMLEQGQQVQFHSIAVPTKLSCYSRPIKLNLNGEIIEYENYSKEEKKHHITIESKIAAFVKKIDLNFDFSQ